MTVIRPNSVSGINSITAQADEIKVFKSDGTQGGLIIGGANLNATSGISTLLALNVTGNVSIAGTLTYQDVTNIDSVGIITARSTIDAQGDVFIGDKIVHSGDTNTAIRFPAADTITAETGGSERLRISSGGSIGIGTDNPQQDIHILRSQLSRVRIESTSTTHNADVTFQNPDGLLGVVGYNATLDTINIDSRGGTNGITFTRSGTERARIDTSGRLLIGTTTEGHAAADDLTIATSGSTGITIRSGTSSEGNIFFSDATSGDAEYAGFITYDHSTNNMRFTTNATERLRILSNGRVGVGTDSPLSVLTAYGENRGEGTVTGQITAKDNAAYNASPTAGLVFQGHYASNNAQAIFSGITGFKENANDGNYAGALALHTRANGSVAQERLRITSTGSVLSSTSFVSKATADVNVTISTASGFTANTYVTVINHGVLEEESVYIISFKWNHQTSGQQPYFSHGAFVFNPSEVNTGSTGGQGPNHIPFQGHHMHTGVNRYWSFRYYGATGGTSVHGLQAAFDQTLDQGSGAGILTIRATKIAKVTTI